MNPGAYNNTVRILPTAGSVLIVTEMVHQARVVPLVAPETVENWRTRSLRSSLRFWQGDARGYWQGDVLVVETRGFTQHTSFLGSGSGMRLVERFAPIGEDLLEYTYTVDDPTSFTRPFTARLIMIRGGPMYEYACHEGNRALRHILEAARYADSKESVGAPVAPDGESKR